MSRDDTPKLDGCGKPLPPRWGTSPERGRFLVRCKFVCIYKKEKLCA